MIEWWSFRKMVKEERMKEWNFQFIRTNGLKFTLQRKQKQKSFISSFLPAIICDTIKYDEGRCFTFPSRFPSPRPFTVKKCPFHRDFIVFFHYSNKNLHDEIAGEGERKDIVSPWKPYPALDVYDCETYGSSLRLISLERAENSHFIRWKNMVYLRSTVGTLIDIAKSFRVFEAFYFVFLG
jgi:hypothetical protein